MAIFLLFLGQLYSDPESIFEKEKGYLTETFELQDTDQDGLLSPSEIQAEQSRVFKILDLNQDGFLRGGESITEVKTNSLALWNATVDIYASEISKEKFDSGFIEIYKRMDKNTDNYVSRDEYMQFSSFLNKKAVDSGQAAR